MGAQDAIAFKAPSLLCLLWFVQADQHRRFVTKTYGKICFFFSINDNFAIFLTTAFVHGDWRPPCKTRPLRCCVHETRFWEKNSELTITFLWRESIITSVLAPELQFKQIAKCLCFPYMIILTFHKLQEYQVLTFDLFPKASQSVTYKKSSLRTRNAFCFFMLPR